MRKLTGALVLLFFLGTLAAAQTSTLGFIDVQKVFKSYKATSAAQEKLSKQEETFKKEFDESQTKLAEAEKNGKSKEEIEKMKGELEKKLAPKRETLLKLNEELTLKLQQDIVKAVKAVAGKVGIEVVVDKQVVIIGGTDLTDLVISELNK